MRKPIERANKLIGKGFSDRLDEIVLMIGSDEFTRQEMIDILGCGNFNAASIVSKLIKSHVTSIESLYQMNPADLLRLKGLGATCMWVLMCALDSRNYNVEKWWGWNNGSGKFSAYQHRVMKRAKKRG